MLLYVDECAVEIVFVGNARVYDTRGIGEKGCDGRIKYGVRSRE